MQLWRKNFLVTVLLFNLIVNASLFFIILWTFKTDLHYELASAQEEEITFVQSLKKLYYLKASHADIQKFCEQYTRYYTDIKLLEDGEMIVDTLPKNKTVANLPKQVKLVTINHKRYLTMSRDFKNYQGKEISLIYLKNCEPLYVKQKQRLLWAIAVSIFLSIVVSSLLYLTMKKIYRPIENIAHELRTPLTNIQGYSDYMIRAKTTEEERFHIHEQIFEASNHLTNVIEKLLIMGNLQNGEIATHPVDIERLLREIQKDYPTISINNRITTLSGNAILLKSLFTNLVSNAFKNGTTVTITGKKNAFTITNDGPKVPKWKLHYLNRNRKLGKEHVTGMGQGVSICHEIMKVHQGSLHYCSTSQAGTTVTLTFPKASKHKKRQ